MNVTLVESNIGYSPLPNLGLAYLISSIDKEHSVNLIDLTFQWKDYNRFFQESLLKVRPDVIGFSVSTYNLATSIKFARIAKNVYPDVHVTFGGTHPTLCPDEVIQQPVVDSICIGEGEGSFREFLGNLEKGLEPRVDGFWFKDRRGMICRNNLRPFEPDLDQLPLVNWDHWDIKRYLSANFVYLGEGGLMHISSRGCPYSCSFCSAHTIRNSVPGKYYRLRSPEKILEEIERNISKYWKYGFRSLAFFDALFGADWRQFEKFCTLYIKEGLNKIIPWSCSTRAEVVTGEWARLAAEAGCVKVDIGVESANEYLRQKVFRKSITNRQIDQAVNNLKDNGIYYLFFMMIGSVEESRQTIKENTDFIKKYLPLEVRMPFCQPLPKTDYAVLTGESPEYQDDDLALLKGADKCRIGSKYLSKGELNRLMFSYRMWWILRWLKGDFLRFGFRLVFDIMKYILDIGGIRPLPLRHPFTYKLIKAKTHLRYHLEDWKRKHGFLRKEAALKILNDRFNFQ